MKKILRLALTAATVAAVFGLSPAPAHDDCTDAEMYKYCGEHVRRSKLPLKFFVLTNTVPAQFDSADISSAVNGAAGAWNAIWPARGTSGACNASALCYGGLSSGTLDIYDSVSTISWGDPSVCPNIDPSKIAVACVLFEGSSGLSRHRIKAADIILNSTKTWAQPELLAGSMTSTINNAKVLAEGEVEALYPCPACGASWYDLQSVLTHELGHVLGLEDIGSGTQWPGSARDSVKFSQTMYRFYFTRTTNKRTLDYGDILGAQHAASDTLTDP